VISTDAAADVDLVLTFDQAWFNLVPLVLFVAVLAWWLSVPKVLELEPLATAKPGA